MGQSKKAVVENFLSKFHGGSWPDFDQVVSLFSEEAVCYVVYPSTPPVHGRQALKEELQRQSKDSSNPRCEIKGIACEGDRVYVERVDYFVTLGKPISVCFCSVFEVGDDHLIKAWREYLDPADPARQLGIGGEDLEKLLQG